MSDFIIFKNSSEIFKLNFKLDLNALFCSFRDILNCSDKLRLALCMFVITSVSQK